MNNWLHIIQNCLFPPTCLLCGQAGVGNFHLCDDCFQCLIQNQPACPRCALPLPHTSSELCGQCLKSPPPFDRTFALFRYEEPVRNLIHCFKFRSGYAYGKLLGTLLAQGLQENEERPELILPIPLHRNRYSSRGYNQSLEIARVLSKTLSIPVDYQSLRRVLDTKPQLGLRAKDRRRNLKKAFALTRELSAKHVAILDDVITTGSTVSEVAKLIRKAGVERIEVWACARAGRPR